MDTPLPQFLPPVRPAHRVAAASLALLAVSLSAAAADVWRWVDEHGAVHFSDRAAGHDAAERYELRPSPPASAAGEKRLERTRRLIETFRSEREERRESWAEARAEIEQRRHKCEQAKAEQRRRETAAHLYYEDAEGNKRIVDGAEYDAALQESRDAVREWCA